MDREAQAGPAVPEGLVDPVALAAPEVQVGPADLEVLAAREAREARVAHRRDRRPARLPSHRWPRPPAAARSV